VTLKDPVKDLAGNVETDNLTFSFTTHQDNVRPRDVGHTPESDATDVPVNVSPTVTFDESLKPETVSGSSIQLWQGGWLSGTRIPVTISYDEDSKTVKVDPNSDLEEGKSYSVVYSGMQDLAGNGALFGSWRFTTHVTPPTPVEHVVTVDPDPLDFNVVAPDRSDCNSSAKSTVTLHNTTDTAVDVTPSTEAVSWTNRFLVPSDPIHIEANGDATLEVTFSYPGQIPKDFAESHLNLKNSDGSRILGQSRLVGSIFCGWEG
jgi:hypothetical protein